jgi:cell division protein FtsL
MANINEAYDLDLFRPREPRLVALENNKKVVQDNRKRARRHARFNVVVYLALALTAVAIIGYLITCNVRMTEMNKTIADYHTELNTLHSERVRLEAELSGKTSAEQINKYAQENGMLPADSHQIYYIVTDGEDVVSVPDGGQNWFERLWEAISDIFT